MIGARAATTKLCSASPGDQDTEEEAEFLSGVYLAIFIKAALERT